MSTLYVIRHGQANFGGDDYDRLSDLGRQQAALAGEYLAGLGLMPDAVYTGGMRRQDETAQEILARLPNAPPLAALPEFREYDSDAIIGALVPAMAVENPAVKNALPNMHRDRAAFQLIFEGAMGRWIAGHQAGGAETWQGFLARVESGLAQVMRQNESGKRVLLVSSGGPICAVLKQALGLSSRQALEISWVIKNASISSLFYSHGKLTLATFNCTPHLDGAGKGLITYR